MRIERIEVQGHTFSAPIGIIRRVYLRDDPHRQLMVSNGEHLVADYYECRCLVCDTDFSTGDYDTVTTLLGVLREHLEEHDRGFGGEDDLTDEERDAIVDMCCCDQPGKPYCPVGWHH